MRYEKFITFRKEILEPSPCSGKANNRPLCGGEQIYKTYPGKPKNGIRDRRFEVEVGKEKIGIMSRFAGWDTADALDVKVRQQAKKKGETANQITRNILRAVNMQPGCVAYRVNNVGVWDEAKQVRRKGNTEKGLPDIFGCIRGKTLAVEVKAGRDKMSMEQLYRKNEIERAGGLYFEARSTDEFLKWFVEKIK